MNHQRRIHGPLGPVLLISMQLCLDGCAGLFPRHHGSTARPSAPEHETAVPVSSSGAMVEGKRLSAQPAAAKYTERLDSTSSPLGLPPCSGEPPRSPGSTGDHALEPGQNLQFLADSQESQLRYEEQAREMGASAEKEGLHEYLARGTDDPAFLNFGISWHLDRQEYDVARYLLRRAQAKNQPVSLWQRLVLAMDDGDPEAVERLLRESDGKLPVDAQVESLRGVDLNEQALALAQNYLDSMPTDPKAEKLASQVNALALSSSHVFGLDWATQKLGSLGITNGTALLDLYTPLARVALEVTENWLDSTNGDVLSVNEFDTELDVSLRASRVQPFMQMELELGGNIRDDDSVLYGQVEWTQRITPDLLGRFEFGFNEITNATPILRAIGTKDSLAFSATAHLDRWEFARAKLELHRYQTRGDDRLGTGYSIEAALGHVVLQELPRWLVELRGSLEKNDLGSEVPPELIPSVLPVPTAVDAIIPTEYRSLGIGTTLQFGRSGSAQKRFQFDAWTGWLWPADELGYNVRLSAGTSVFSRDMLSLDAFYANALSGVANQAYQHIGISYRYHF